MKGNQKMTVLWMCLFLLALGVVITDRIICFTDHGCSCSKKTCDPYKTHGEIPLPQ